VRDAAVPDEPVSKPSFLLAENQLPQLALDRLKLGGVDERVGAGIEE